MGDQVTLHAGCRIAEWDVLERQLPDERATLPHHDGHQIDRDLIEQPDLKTTTGTSMCAAHPNHR